MTLERTKTGQFASSQQPKETTEPGEQRQPRSTRDANFDRAALESKVKDRLAALGGEPTEEEPKKPADETDDSSAEQQPAEEEAEQPEAQEEQKPEDGEEPSAEQENEEDAPEAAAPPTKNGNAPTLPAAYRRSLKANGEWTDEEIDQNLALLGGKFVEIAAKVHQSRNAETARWAAIGRAAREQTVTEETETQIERTPAKKPAKASMALKPVDVKALKDKYGDDAIIDAIAGPVNEAIAQMSELLPQIQRTQQVSEEAKLETLGRRIEEFFGGEELKPYSEIYGDGKKEFTEGQLAARNKLLEMADALTLGAKIQGRNLSLGESLSMAHDSLSGGYKVKAARTEIKKSLKQRNKTITLKPGNKSGQPAGGTGEVKSRADLEKKVKGLLSNLFKK